VGSVGGNTHQLSLIFYYDAAYLLRSLPDKAKG